MTPVLELQNVKKSLGGAIVLDDVNLRVEPGEALALVGPNGAGKTTILNLVSRETTPDAGDVLVQGVSILDLSPWELVARGVARVSQTSRLSPALTVADHIHLGMYWSRSRVGVLAPATRGGSGVSLNETSKLAAELKQILGLSERDNQRVGTLSHSQRRSVEILRATVTQPRLLLLDEPTAGMSEEEREPVRAAAIMLREAGTAILLVEHNIAFTAAVAVRCALLQAGRILKDGPTGSVLESDELRSSYLGA